MPTQPLSVLCLLAAASVLACVPTNNTPVEGIPQIKTLAEVMDVQATAADPQFGKSDQQSFTDAEFTSMGQTAAKIDATSKRIKNFTKGPEFDALADKLGANATALAEAASSKNGAGARKALVDMKGTCKQCHEQFR